MNTNVWAEAGGPLLKEALRQEARTLHQMSQPPASLEQWQTMRRKLRRQIREAAGTFPAGGSLDVQEHGTLAMDGYRIVKLTYQSRPGLRVTANLYRPDGPGPFPAVLNVHGHFLLAKAAPNVAARGHTLAKEGFVTLCVDAIGAGERGTEPGAFEHHGQQQGVSLLSLGETLLGMQVYDNMRGIDLLQSLDCVDGERIGVTGASGGGNQTMWLAALDPRVKAAVPVVSVGTFEAYVTNFNCACEVLPTGLALAEEWAVLGMIAPNPLLILNALQEKLPAFQFTETMRSVDRARQVYRLLGVEDRIACQSINLPHGYFPEMRRHMLGWFKRWLCDEGTGWPTAIPDVPELPEAELMCFPGKSRPSDIGSLIEYVSHRSQAMARDRLNEAQVDRADKRRHLRRLLRVPAGPDHQRCSAVVVEEVGDRHVEKFAVEVEPNVLIPCTLICARQPTASAVVIAAHPDGKQACLNESACEEALQAGKAVCLVDLRHLGETCWMPPEELDRHVLRSALWLGRTMIGDWVKDLLAVRAVIAKRATARRVELLGFGEPGLAMLAAAALDKRFDAVTVVDLLSTYVVSGAAPVQRFSIFVPGMLRWGDVPLLAALAHCPVQPRSLVRPTGDRLSAQEHAGWTREVEQWSARLQAGRSAPQREPAEAT